MSPSKQAFLNWYAEKSLGGTPTKEAEEAFQAGIEYMLNATSHLNRKGSDLRGRVVSLFRPLWPDEIQRELPSRPWPLHWPALELDDGTIVYAAKQTPETDSDGKPRYGPAQLVGQKKIDGEWQKVAFNLTVQDVQVDRAKEDGDASRT